MQWKMASVYSSIFILPLWFLLLTRVDALSVNRSEEVNALLSFRDGNNLLMAPRYIGNWAKWNETDETPCAWLGVTCTANFTVEELDFGGWGLFLDSLDALYNLTDLRRLDLSNNYVGDAVSDIGNLTGLTRLDLSQAHLGDSISSISWTRNLRYLALDQNYIQDVPSGMRNLVNLQVLNLSDNLLSSPFPIEALGGLRNLVNLDLSRNLLYGTVPVLPDLASLSQLVLDNNSFTGFDEPWVIGTKSLEQLTVSNNQLEGVIPSSIPSNLNLMVLDLSGNNLSGQIPTGFSALMTFGFQLDLSRNQLTGKIPVGMLQQLLAYTQIDCPIVNVSHNLLTGDIPIDGSKFYCFALLDLSYNKLSGPIPWNKFSNKSSIDSLWLTNNQLSGDIVDVFFSHAFSDTVWLHLENNMLTGDLSRMANTSLVGSLFGNLLELDLSNNHLQWSTSEVTPDPVKATLDTLTSGTVLSYFRVGGNNFSGTSLPTACFGNTTLFLYFLDLSNCHLKGEISGSAFNSSCLPDIELLNLSNNHATGPLLESIILAHRVSYVLDVSNNNLSGPLPPIPPSSNLYNPKYFAGNDGLCGYPLTPCPGPLFKQTTGVQWWVLSIIIGGSATIALGSCLVAMWRWRVYQKQHQQDADLIRTLLERDSAVLMPLRELKKATDNFAQSAKIGEGGFGTVYMGKLNDGTIVAVKRSKQEGSERNKEQFLNEVRILSQVNHRHLVKLLGCCMENKTAVLVFEFVPNGTLQEHLQRKIGSTHLNWKQRLNIAIQTADALYYLHSAATFPIFHRDVKSANILLDETLNAKVADFGISKLVPLHATHVSTAAIQGTMGYIDPEYYTSFQLNDKSDVYSFGVVFLELISAKPALDFGRGGDDTSLVNLARPYIERGDLEQFIDPVLAETYRDPGWIGKESILGVARLALKCLDMSSRKRPSMNEVLKELQNIWYKFHEASKNLDSINEGDNEDLQLDNIALLSRSLSGNSSTFTIEIGLTSDIEMSPLSPLPRFRSRSIG